MNATQLLWLLFFLKMLLITVYGVLWYGRGDPTAKMPQKHGLTTHSFIELICYIRKERRRAVFPQAKQRLGKIYSLPVANPHVETATGYAERIVKLLEEIRDKLEER